jgi:hypothetical protein
MKADAIGDDVDVKANAPAGTPACNACKGTLPQGHLLVETTGTTVSVCVVLRT